MIKRYCVLAACLAPAWLLSAAVADEYESRSGQWIQVPTAAEGSAAGELVQVRKRLEAGKHRSAVKAAGKFVKKYPDNAGCEEAMMYAGQAEMNRGRYYQAFEWFDRQLGQYPAGEFSERALAREYDIGDAFLKGKKRISAGIFYLPAADEGLEILLRIAEHAPGTAIAEKALLRIGEYHYLKGDHAEAVEAYDHYLQLFPSSAKAGFAMLQAARAMYAAYRGVGFDGTPLIEAEQRFRTFAERYPAEAGKAGVGGILMRIAAQRAEKLFSTAGFYQRTRRRSVAVFYYKQVIETYPRSAWATKARVALVSLGKAEAVSPSPREGVTAPPDKQNTAVGQEGRATE